MTPCIDRDAPRIGVRVCRSWFQCFVKGAPRLPASAPRPAEQDTIVRAHRLTKYSRLCAALRAIPRACMGRAEPLTPLPLAIVGPLLLASRSVRIAHGSACPRKQGKAVRSDVYRARVTVPLITESRAQYRQSTGKPVLGLPLLWGFYVCAV